MRRMRREKGRTNVCGGEGPCEKMRGRRGGQICEVERVHVRRMRGRRGGQICEVERVHVRRMRGEKGRTNVCGGEGAGKRMRELTSQLSSVVSSLSIASERSLRTLPVKNQ